MMPLEVFESLFCDEFIKLTNLALDAEEVRGRITINVVSSVSDTLESVESSAPFAENLMAFNPFI